MGSAVPRDSEDVIIVIRMGGPGLAITEDTMKAKRNTRLQKNDVFGLYRDIRRETLSAIPRGWRTVRDKNVTAGPGLVSWREPIGDWHIGDSIRTKADDKSWSAKIGTRCPFGLRH